VEPFGVSHAEWIERKVKQAVQVADARYRSLRDRDRQWIAHLMSGARSALAVGFTPRLVMQDYKEDNAVAQSTDSGWEISGVFDFAESYFSDGEIALCRNIGYYLERDLKDCVEPFISGYLEERHVRPGVLERSRVYMLLDRLIIWNFGQRVGVWWDRQLSLEQWVSSFMVDNLLGRVAHRTGPDPDTPWRGM
jgi:hypothetical protein